MVGKLTKSVNGDQIGRSERGPYPLGLLIRVFSADGIPLTIAEFQELEWITVSLPAPSQRLLHHHRSFRPFVDCQSVGDDRALGTLPVFKLEFNWPFCASSLQFLAPSSAIPRMTKAGLKTLRQEIENVKHCGFAAAIRSQKNRHGGQILELHVAQGPIIFDF